MEHTVIWIRDANRPVVRLRARPFLMYGLASAFVFLVLAAVVLSALCVRLWTERQELARALDTETERFNRSSAEQTRVIEQLRAEMTQLSRQAEEIGRQIAEMEKLETSLRSIAGPGIRLPAENDAGGPSGSPPAADTGRGGPETGSAATAPADEMFRLSASVQSAYDTFSGRTRDLSDRLLSALRRLRSTPGLWPTDSRSVSSGFGYRKDPFTGRKTFHTGIDIAANTGDPVYATADGRVVETGSDRVRGRYVVLDHGNGFQTAYLHLSRIVVTEGDSVEAGDVVGHVGSTGRSTGPHLHYEVIRNGRNVDPDLYLPD